MVNDEELDGYRRKAWLAPISRSRLWPGGKASLSLPVMAPRWNQRRRALSCRVACHSRCCFVYRWWRNDEGAGFRER